MFGNPWNAQLRLAAHATMKARMTRSIRLLVLAAVIAAAMIGVAVLAEGALAYVSGAAALAVLLVLGAPLALVPPRISRKKAHGLVGAPR